MTIIKHRRGTADQWATTSRILASGEIGLELDSEGRTTGFKIGNATLPWADLPYGSSSQLNDQELADLLALEGGQAKSVLTGSYATRQIDTVDLHNEKIGGGPANDLPDQGTHYGNLMVGGGGSGTASPNKLIGQESLRTIVGGYNNTINANLASGILHGMHGVIDGTSNHAIIVGGSLQAITDAQYATIVGGTGGRALADYATVIGGNTGRAAGLAAIALGGSSAKANGAQSAVLAGNGGEARANRSAVVGGDGILITGQQGVSGGRIVNNHGASALVVGDTLTNGAEGTGRGDYNALVGGLNHNVGATVSSRFVGIVGGRDHIIDGAEYASIVGGKAARARHWGAQVQAMGSFATTGDAQTYSLLARRQTTDATPGDLRIDGVYRLAVPNGAAWAFTALVSARATTDGDCAMYEITGAIRNVSGVVSLVGTPTVTAYESNAAWDLAVTANDTNDCLELTATGVAATTINWNARVQVVEVLV